MNTSTPTPSQAGSAPVKAHTAAHHNAKKTGAEAPADLFSNLMALVSATHGEPAADAPTPDTSSEAPHEAPDTRPLGADNPVHALLNWASPSALAATAATQAALAGDHAPAAHPPLAGQPSVAASSIELTGMTPLSAATPLDAEAAAALTAATAPNASSPLTASALAASLKEPGDASLAEKATGARPNTGEISNTNTNTERMGSEGLRAAAPGRADTAPALGARAITANGTWRKAPAHASATAAHEMGSLRALATDGMTGRLGTQAPIMRSTVAMHERLGQAATTFTAAAAGEASAPGTTALRPAGAPTAETAAATPGTAVPDLLDGGTPPDLLNSDDAAQELAHADPLASPEPEAEQISHWGNQNLRHASLRVGQGAEDAIDIRLSMSGQEVRVDFRTDNAETRASLQQSAGESLGELLQRSGIQLGDVSVGAQGQRQDGGTERREAGPVNARRPTEATAEPRAMPAASRPRADGSQPLDVFA